MIVSEAEAIYDLPGNFPEGKGLAPNCLTGFARPRWADLGANHFPEEIAVSITAELIAKTAECGARSCRGGGGAQ